MDRISAFVERLARLLAVLTDQPGPIPRIALAAPTGKAAARLQEAVREEAAKLGAADAAVVSELTATTIQRLLGWRREGFRYNRDLPLPADIVVIDESSMVALTGMAHLMEALAGHTRLILVGDPDQLSSVEAGAVLGDIVARPAAAPAPGIRQALGEVVQAADADLAAAAGQGVCVLVDRYRFTEDIADVADAIRVADPEAALAVLSRPGSPVQLRDPDDPGLQQRILADGDTLWRAAQHGDPGGALAALNRHRLLCAHRHGPFGASWWSRISRSWLLQAHPERSLSGQWYPGRPVMVLKNAPDVGVFNGDSGVVVAHAAGRRVAFGGAAAPRLIAPSRLTAVDSLYAMTIHKSQGSQFDEVSILLPPPSSPLLTRELLYTAVTRARTRVWLIGDADSFVRAIGRPVQRASGLRWR